MSHQMAADQIRKHHVPTRNIWVFVSMSLGICAVESKPDVSHTRNKAFYKTYRHVDVEQKEMGNAIHHDIPMPALEKSFNAMKSKKVSLGSSDKKRVDLNTLQQHKVMKSMPASQGLTLEQKELDAIKLKQHNAIKATSVLSEGYKESKPASPVGANQRKLDAKDLKQHKVINQAAPATLKEIAVSSSGHTKMEAKKDANKMVRRASTVKNKAHLAQADADQAVELMNQAVQRMLDVQRGGPVETAAPTIQSTTLAAAATAATTAPILAAEAAATTAAAPLPATTAPAGAEAQSNSTPPPVLPSKDLLPPGAWAAMGIGFLGIFVLIVSQMIINALKPRGQDDPRDYENCTVDRMDEDCYGMAIAALIRDSQRLVGDTGAAYKMLRMSRIIASFTLLFLIMALQIFLLEQVRAFGSAEAVHDTREVYDDFEQKMYNGHVTFTVNGKARGEDGFFDFSRFNELSEEEKDVACKIPFSQPMFLASILLVWSLTVVGEIKSAILIFERLVVNTETAGSMVNATEETEDGDVIHRLTVPIKAVVTIIIVLPRIVIASILLWLGCRWLSATSGFGELILNASALEFVLLTKDLLYSAMVPNRSKREVGQLKISLRHESGPPSVSSFLGSFLWGVMSVFWTLMYMYVFQSVLPDYKYDIHDVCVAYIKERYA